MKRSLGKWKRISSSRQMIVDLMYFSTSLPLVAMERTMRLKNVLDARERHPERPPWTALFAKGFGLVAREIAQLRQVYIGIPTPRIFEYHESVVSIAYELNVEGEAIVLPVRIRHPDQVPLTGFRFKLDEMRDGYLARRGFYRILNDPRLFSCCNTARDLVDRPEYPAPAKTIFWHLCHHISRISGRSDVESHCSVYVLAHLRADSERWWSLRSVWYSTIVYTTA